MNAKDVPSADFSSLDSLSKRFSMNSTEETPTSPTSHTSKTNPQSPTGKTSEAPKARRTYYYSRDVADALAAAVDDVHYSSRGRISKNEALDAIITAGIDQLDQIKAHLNL